MIMLCNLCLSGFFYKKLNKEFDSQLFWANAQPYSFTKILNNVNVLSQLPRETKCAKYVDFGDDAKYIVIDNNQCEDKCNISPQTFVVTLENDIHIIYPHYNSTEEIVSKYKTRMFKNTDDEIVVVFYAYPFFEDNDIKEVLNNPYKTIVISTRNLEHLINNTENQVFIKIDNLHHNKIKEIADESFDKVVNIIKNKFKIVI